jgi:hypothetical protein
MIRTCVRANDRGILRRRLAASIGLCLTVSFGCAGTVKQAAREAAPAAVREGVEEVQKPETRGDIAEILADPRIMDATRMLSEAIVEGALNGLTDAERTERLQRLADAFVMRIGASMTRSLERDLGPQLSATLANTFAQSLERALGSETEQRLQAIALSVTRATMQGLGEALVDPSGQPSPVLRQTFGQVMREMAYEASLGFDSAVHDARAGGPRGSSGEALAALGTLSSWVVAIPPLLVGGALLVGLAGTAALIWALYSLRRQRRLSRANEDAVVALARAMRSQGPSDDEFFERVSRAARDEHGGSELRRLLRERTELGPSSRREGPPSQRGIAPR